MSNTIVDELTVVAIEYWKIIRNPKHIPLWIKYSANDLGRLLQGIDGRLDGTNTTCFIQHDTIHKNIRKYVTYELIVVNFRPQKDDPYCTLLTVEVNLIKYPN